jgi:2-polyprenyl-3-methyl-5-hydroxy-6-metoxy-1,4-benzoquinol methylase
MKEKVNCNLCGQDKPKFLFKKEGYNFVKCQNCGLIYVNPRDDQATILKRYQEPYFHIKDFQNKNPDVVGYFDYVGDRPIYEEYFEQKLKQIEKIRPAPGKILDIGCSLGYFLNRAKAHGYQTYGIEISEYAFNFAKKSGHKVLKGELKDNSFPKEYFDVITLFQTIEHFPNPSAELKKIYSFLKKDGLLVITSPNANSLVAKSMGKKWFSYRLEHLYYFTPKTIKILLQEAGFKKIIIKSDNYVAYPLERVLERITYNFRSKFTLILVKFLESGLKFLRLLKLRFKIPLGDIMILAFK